MHMLQNRGPLSYSWCRSIERRALGINIIPSPSNRIPPWQVEGEGAGAEAREKRAGKREERGWEEGFLRWWEPGENE